MIRDHWGATIQTPTLGGQREAPLQRLPTETDRCALRCPSEQRRLRDADERRGSRRQPGRVALDAAEGESRDDEPSDDGGGVG